MDPVSAIGLASSILTFIDIGYKVVSGTLETAQTGRAPHTEHIDVVAHDLNDVVARFGQPVSPNASEPEKALGHISVRCQALLTELLALLDRFKVQAAKPGVSWDKFKVVVRRIRNDSKVQELQKSLEEYRSQILVQLVTIFTYVASVMPPAQVTGNRLELTTNASDRQLATQTQIGNSMEETRTDLHRINDALNDVRAVLKKLEASQLDLRSATRQISNTDRLLPDQSALLDKLAIQSQEVRHALDHLAAGRSDKTPETRILEQVYPGGYIFQREEKLKPADGATFRWFVEGVSSKSDADSGKMGSEAINRDDGTFLPTKDLKVEAASRFEKWLRCGRGLFHISGKAGSGKSTLMKLILSTERTHEFLREWPGGKRLLFARFYFWAGGAQLQNSLEGLQRSIIFEILIQRPELVKEVFHEAYPIAAAESTWDSPMNSRFFTTASFQKAFERLLRLPSDPRYRLCLFIDGLDEYGAELDSGSLSKIQRGDLAQGLVDWTSNDHTKILVSSRPHSEFINTFVEDQRVHLHQLTHDDMIEFGRHLFERHRCFGFPGVKQRYRDIVVKVVDASNGVFLWTGLTIQRLLVSLARRDSFESLEKLVDATPRELKALYEEMFLSIDKHDRHEAMKMMLLVSEERKCLGNLSHFRGVNAMAIGWLELLQNPEFPANQPFVVYTEEEIEDKRQFAESRVNGYTGGLLEVVTQVPERKGSFVPPTSPRMRHTVQFFHRTALEYVTTSPVARDVLSSLPNLFNLEFYTRLSLAELHFGLPLETHISWYHDFDRYLMILRKYLSTPSPCRSLIEAYRTAFTQKATSVVLYNVRICLNGVDQFYHWNDIDQSASFDHWVANAVKEAYAAHYLTERIETSPDLSRPLDDLSMLLSVACRDEREDLTFHRLDRVKMILALGADLHDRICLQLETGHYQYRGSRTTMELSVWQAWCLYYVTAKLHTWQKQTDDDLDKILELFLATGANSDCYILMRDLQDPYEESSGETSKDSESENDPKPDGSYEQSVSKQPETYLWSPANKWPTLRLRPDRFKTAYAVSLRDFIRQTKPRNYESLGRLLSEENNMQESSTPKLSEIEAELATCKHPDFKFPTVRLVNSDLDQFFTNEYENWKLMVYWIRWKDATIPGFLELRLW